MESKGCVWFLRDRIVGAGRFGVLAKMKNIAYHHHRLLLTPSQSPPTTTTRESQTQLSGKPVVPTIPTILSIATIPIPA